MSNKAGFSNKAEASVIRSKAPAASLGLKGSYEVECYGVDGEFKWREEGRNVISFEGMIHLLEVGFDSTTSKTNNWYGGLINGTSVTSVEADTMASHAGWTEDQTYSEATREEWLDDAAASGAGVVTMANSTVMEFNMNGTTNIAGIFISSVSTKGSGTGVLWAAAAFSGYQAVNTGDVLRVTYTITSDNA